MPRHPLPDPLRERLPARLRAHRERLGLTQEALAERAHVRVQSISRMETSDMQPSVAMLWRVSRALGCTMGDLLDDAKDQEPAADERAMIAAWRAADPTGRDALLTLLGSLRR